MSFDIYGQPLERGHCEVHPWIGEEYPCLYCLQETEERKKFDRELDAYYAEQMRLQMIEDFRGLDGDGI